VHPIGLRSLISTHLKQLAPIEDTAMLVRGVDTEGHFEQEQRPRADLPLRPWPTMPPCRTG
jgi:hypothetical protein